MSFEIFAAAFLLAVVSEIADKTQLVILGLALQYRSPLKVFLGAFIAHSAMDGIAILLGSLFGVSLPLNIIKPLVGIVFIALGVWTITKLYIKKKTKEKKVAKNKNAFIASLLTVMASEAGDKTQVSSGLLAAQSLQPFPVFAGFALGVAIAIGANVFLGSKVAANLPRRGVKIATGVLFVLFGLISLFL